jgi:glyoxylase-like metal-dependent hydrolase (beta-lactamase superfamily II)
MKTRFEEINETVIGFEYPTRFSTDFHYYLVRHSGGNILVGCPEQLDPEIDERIGEMGGIGRIFLTHRHDVGAIAQYKDQYDAQVIMHKTGQYHLPIPLDLPFEDDTADGKDRDLAFVHTPGHTPENACLLLQTEKFLFTGDTVCIDEGGIPFIYRHKSGIEEMSDEEVRLTARKLEALNFTDIYSGVSGGFCLGNAKELLRERYKRLL